MSAIPQDTAARPASIDANGSSESAPAQIIRDDAEAIARAHEVAARLAEHASERDRERRLPHEEIDWFSQAGLWAITVPKEYGGAGVSYVTLIEVIKIIAAADPSLAQLPQNHLGLVDVIALTGTPEQKQFFFGEILKGKRFGNGFSDFRSRRRTPWLACLHSCGYRGPAGY
jgi:alkylation response protein AidB-like acyl-CoA dehydrogenase